MEFRVLTSFLVGIWFFSGCTKEVKIDIPGYEEQIVVDGRIETGQPPIVLISKTQEIYSETSLDTYLNSFQSGAVVTVSDGTTTVVLDEICSDALPPGYETYAAQLFGISVSELANYHLCAYTTLNTAIWGQVGKTYSLNIQLNGQTYTSSTTIVQPTALDTVYWKQDNSADNGWGFTWAKLTDLASQYDSYFWQVKRMNMVNGEPKDADFKATFNPAFDDEFINGQTFEFYYENPQNWDDETIESKNRGHFQVGDSVVVKFSKVDAAVYDYLEKKYMQLATNGNPFASPTSIPSNLSGGALGVWAGYSTWFDTILCQP